MLPNDLLDVAQRASLCVFQIHHYPHPNIMMARESHFQSLPDELQVHILKFCDMPTLFNTCLVCHKIYDKVHPILWGAIDFVSLRLHGFYDEDDTEKHRRFFETCQRTRKEYPDRWAILAALPRVLKLSRLPGIWVDLPIDTSWESRTHALPSEQTNIYDVISDFRNLEAFTLFVVTNGHAGNNKIWPEGPPQSLLFLQPIENRFIKLQRLHLSKLAQMHEEHEPVTSCSWYFDDEVEKEVLREWARFLAHVSPTLTHLTLENCYFMNRSRLENGGLLLRNHETGIERVMDPPVLWLYDRTEEDLDVDPLAYGKESSDRARDILGPAMAASEFPILESLVLKGMMTFKPLPFLDSKVNVEYWHGGIAQFEEDDGVVELSPPAEAFKENPFVRLEGRHKSAQVQSYAWSREVRTDLHGSEYDYIDDPDYYDYC